MYLDKLWKAMEISEQLISGSLLMSGPLQYDAGLLTTGL
jgi:hypothetical protein